MEWEVREPWSVTPAVHYSAYFQAIMLEFPQYF